MIGLGPAGHVLTSSCETALPNQVGGYWTHPQICTFASERTVPGVKAGISEDGVGRAES